LERGLFFFEELPAPKRAHKAEMRAKQQA
jgi:hypothetical protein